MKVTVNKCEQCGAVIEDDATYEKHVENHAKLTLLDGAFPPVQEEGSCFANGYWCVKRDADWLARYKDRVQEIVGDIGYPAWSYEWFRSLSDGASPFYGVACRAMNVCPKCFREWGQPWFANHCQHIRRPR